MRIVVTGGSGQVGTILARHFYQQKHDVVVVARRSSSVPWRVVLWDGQALGDWARDLVARWELMRFPLRHSS